MRITPITTFASLVLLAACARTRVSMLEPAQSRAPTCKDAVAIYTTPSDAPAGYHEVALIQSTASALTTTSSSVRNSMRAKAATVGATGIILTGIDAPSTASTIARTAASWPAYREGMALAVFSESDSARVRSICAAP